MGGDSAHVMRLYLTEQRRPTQTIFKHTFHNQSVPDGELLGKRAENETSLTTETAIDESEMEFFI